VFCYIYIFIYIHIYTYTYTYIYTVSSPAPCISSGRSSFSYRSSGPASVTLWPFLSSRLRVLIYNGDADACVPYKGNEEWISDLETQGVLKEKAAWRPWYVAGGAKAPAGYVTSYTPKSARDFSFLTVRLAGHMVPTYQPEAALAFFSRFLEGKPF